MHTSSSFASLHDAESYLDGLINRERQVDYDYEAMGLRRVRALLDAIGSPERGLPCIHIAGSKGKGTTALATECLLRAAGRRTGTFTSPHLESWLERFRIDGEAVSAELLMDTLARIRPAIDALRADAELCPSFFDVVTALALELFRGARVDFGVIEVGLGGRLDSTNVVESVVSVVTAIQLEHTDKLGTTLEAIAMEKAGIFRKGVPALHGPLDPDAAGAIVAKAVAADAPLREVRARDVCARRAAPASRAASVSSAASVSRAADEFALEFALEDGRRVRAPVLGEHQADNLALAVAAAEQALARPLGPAELRGLAGLQLPARLERFGERTVLDCAHSPDSVRALRRALCGAWPDRPWRLVLSVARDKDAAGIAHELAPAVRACIVTAAEPLRSLSPGDLAPLVWAAGVADVEQVDDPIAALERAQSEAQPDELVVVTGSVYLAGALRGRLQGGKEN